MAVFIPDVKPEDFNNSPGEKEVYEALKLLGKDYTVFYSLSWISIGNDRTIGEADFILFHPVHEKMKQYVTLDKRSKKAQREYYAKQRTTWGELNPVTRSVPSGKAYNRKKEKQRIGVEFRNGFDADFLRSLVLLIHFRTSERSE